MKRSLIILLFIASLTSLSQTNCIIQIEEEILICDTGSIQLNATGSNLVDVKWIPEDGLSHNDIANPIAKIDSDITYVVVNRVPIGQELIFNGDFSMGNTGFTSEYSESCLTGSMPQGTYCVNDKTNGYWPNWGNCDGHNSGPGDNMMIMDATQQSDVKIWCQTVPTNPNSTYQFSTWVTSVFKDNPPILQFSINGTLMDQPLQAFQEVCRWKEFFSIWESGATTSAEICILNKNTNGWGNDLAIDDISFQEVCFNSDTVEIKIMETPSVDLGNDTTICPGDTFTVINKANLIPGSSYLWDDNSTGTDFKASRPGTVSLEVSTPEGCKGWDTIIIGDKGTPTSNLIKDTTMCTQANTNFLLESGEAETIYWIHDSDTSFTNSFNAIDAGTYHLVMSNGTFCTTTDSVVIESECSKGLFIANAFSPNADGLNDTFGPHAVETYDDYEFLIFDRWGNLIFSGENVHDHWNGILKSGKPAQQGLYVFKLSYSVIDPNLNHLRKFGQVGKVVLIK